MIKTVVTDLVMLDLCVAKHRGIEDEHIGTPNTCPRCGLSFSIHDLMGGHSTIIKTVATDLVVFDFRVQELRNCRPTLRDPQ